MTSFPPSIVLQRVGQDPPDSHRMPFCDQPVPWLACTPRGRTLASRRALQSQRWARHDETWLVLHTASHRRAVVATYCLRRVALDNDRSGIRRGPEEW